MGSMTLTTHRVILHARGCGGESSTSVLLSQVQWTRLIRARHGPLAFTLGALAALALLAVLVGPLGLAWPLGSALLITGTLGPRWTRTRLVVGAGARTLCLPLEPTPRRRRQARELVDLIEQAAVDASRRGSMLRPA